MGKLTGEERRGFLLTGLREQSHLLRKSVRDIVAGDLAEALRVATTIRILVHESSNSKPLLKHLNRNYLEMPILDQVPSEEKKPPPGIQNTVVLSVPIGVNVNSEGVFLNPDLDAKSYAPIPLGNWWRRRSLILPGVGGLSREEVILGLANKEGGAHVDPNISEKYKLLLASKSLMIGWGERSAEPINISRMMAGHSGVEMLDFLDRHFPP